MANKAFRVEGDFQMGRSRQNFVLQVVAASEAAAKEHVYTDLGSRHGATRRLVRIGKVSALSPDDASAVTQHRLNQKK